ncbi:MAG: LysR family transcriptional regulator [Ruminococcaceae bacterium]|nr:LysR family transcriptional regulator [Oscillospiraceae bacterium]
MLDPKIMTLIAVAGCGSFTKAAEKLSLTQPAVSHHINQLESELGVHIFIRNKRDIRLTPEGEIVLKYARRMNAMNDRLRAALADCEKRMTRLRIGITHTSESSLVTEILAKYSAEAEGASIMIITDTINNLYNMIENYELDLAIVDSRPAGRGLNSLLLDTDQLLCITAPESPLASRAMVTIAELKRQKMILRLPTSATRILFESHLESIGESIADFDVILEVDSVAAIKDLIRKDLGISILAKSACLDELNKGKLTALPIENLGMIRETNIVFRKDFGHEEITQRIMALYREASKGHG